MEQIIHPAANSMPKPDLQHTIIYKAFSFFLLLGSASCGTLDPFSKVQENLDKSIKAFNFEFESKSVDSSARFIHPDHRVKFMRKSLEIVQRITFFQATILDIRFFKKGVPAVMTSSGPQNGFDQAIVVIRYQLAVMPSTKLKSLIVEQEWVLFNEQWVMVPDLEALLKRPGTEPDHAN